MADSYSTSFHAHLVSTSLPSRICRTLRSTLSTSAGYDSVPRSRLQLTRLVSMMTMVLLLTFGAVYKLANNAGVYALWPEIILSVIQLILLAGSYHIPLIRRFFGQAVKALCYFTAAWFITMAALNGFTANYAVGLLFIIPGLGVGYGLVSRHILPLAMFFFLNVALAALACTLTAGVGIASMLFIASLICSSLLTMFVAAGWLDAHKRYIASEERYRAVVEQASDGIYLLDANTHNILHANRAFCQMAERPLTELRHTRIEDLILPLPERDSSRAFHVSSQGSERRLRRPDGSTLYVELKADRIADESGDIISVVVHDIQLRKEYEERLLKAKESAEEIANFKSTLLANMSHEIRTPLSSILGWAAVLSDEVPGRQREIVRLIEQNGRRLHNTLDSVIELAHLQANTRKLQPTLLDLNEEITSIAASMKDQAEMKGLALFITTMPEEAWVRVDAGCIRKVLVQLVDNAIKFTERGSVTVSVRSVGGKVAVSVEDTGIGIGREFLPAIFDEFKQESAGLSRDHEGNGLGLSIARRLAELVGAEIDVRSVRGVGSIFTMTVPAVAQPALMRRTA